MEDNNNEQNEVIKNTEAKQEEVITNVETEEKKETIKTKEKDRQGLAIAAMVLGIISLVLFCVWYISIPCSILALIFGIISVKSSKKGMAIAGISTGATSFVLTILLYVFIFFVLGFGTYSGIQNLLDEYEKYYYDYNSNYDLNYDYENEEWF